jgi:hypothetical protein
LGTAYYITVSPPLKDQATLEAYFDIVLANNIVQAYYFAKRQDKQGHKTLFEKIMMAVHK